MRAASVALVAALVIPVSAAATPSILASTPSAATSVAAPTFVVPSSLVAPSALVTPLASSTKGPSKIVLTPTAAMSTSQEVSWTMSSKLKGQKVQYKVAGKKTTKEVKATKRPATSKATSGSSAPRYEATMTKLKAGTTYSYRIVTARGSSSWKSFTTAKATEATTRIIGLGDTQIDNLVVPRRTITRALAAVPKASLVLQAGDVVNNPTKAGQWNDLFGAIGTSGRTRNWVVSIGNHEQCVLITCNSGSAQAFRSYFDGVDNGYANQAQTWYRIDFQGVRIIVLDSFGGRIAEQAKFLDNALATNPNRWSIVLMHAAPFSTRPGRSNPEIAASWLPILEARNVDLVLTGHDHSYVRGYYRNANGPVYASSDSGPKFYDAVDDDWVARKAHRVVWAAGTSTFQAITISKGVLDYRAIVSYRGSTSTSPFGPGGVLDHFVIDKTGATKVVR